MRIRRIVSVLLVICFVLSVCVPGVFAAEKEKVQIIDSGNCSAAGKENDVEWTLNEKGVLTISGTGKMRDYFPGWRKHREAIKRVIIEDGVTGIGKNAFFQCENLSRVDLPESMESIGSYAFSMCLSLKTLEIPENVTRIEDCTFAACTYLEYVDMPEHIESIGASAFQDCSKIKSFRFTESVKKIGENAFERSGLRYIFFDGEAPSIGVGAFRSVYAHVFFFKNHATWTDKTMQNYDGELMWEEIVKMQVGELPSVVYLKLGEKTTLTMEATGNLPSYEWIYRDVNFRNARKAKLASKNEYEVEMQKQRDGRRIRCTVRDIHGNKHTSEAVTLILAATITEHPESINVKKGENAKVSVKAVGHELTYTWYTKNKGDSKFTENKAITGNEFSLTMDNEQNGCKVYCVVTDKYGNTDQSETVTLKMK